MVCGARVVALVLVAAGAAEPAGESPRVWTYEDFLAKRIPPAFTVRQGHPRLLITPKGKRELREKIQAAPGLWRQVIRGAEGGSGEELVLSCGAIYQVGLVAGFQYALSREEYGRKGVAALMDLEVAPRHDRPTMCLLGVPCGYDWLYDLLTDAQKKALAARMAEAAPKYESTFNGPGGRGMLFGLAFWGDGVDDPAAKRIVDHYWTRVWWSPKSTARSVLALLLYLEGGGNTEGLGYFSRNFPFFPTIAAWKTATGQDFFARLGYFRAVPYWLAHSVVPRDDSVTGPYFSIPFYNYSGHSMWNRSYDEMAAAATGYLKDIDPAGASLARWWVDHSRGYENLRFGLVFGLLLGDPRVKAVAPARSGVARTLVMRGTGNVYMRSAWNDPDATVVAFANARFTCLRASAANALCLWHNGGALFLYRGTTARHNYWGRSGAWPLNSVVFYRGDALIRPAHESALAPPAEALGGRWEAGTLSVASEPGEYDYVRGQRARRYVGSARVRLDLRRAERTLVYLRPIGRGKPGYVVILDRIDSGSGDLRPHVVFNTVFEPAIGPSFGQESKGELVVPGQWAIDNAPCAVVTNEHPYLFDRRGKPARAHARAFLRVLAPENIRILKIGGKLHYMDGLDGKGSEDDNFFKAFKRADTNEQVLKGGYWRFHVLPKGDRNRYTVLTAIEATDSRAAQPGALERIDGEGLLGAQVGPSIMLFSRDGKPLTAGSARAAVAGAVRIVVGDLAPGEPYTLTAAGKSTTLTATEAGTICTRAAPLVAGSTIQVGKQGASRGRR